MYRQSVYPGCHLSDRRQKRQDNKSQDEHRRRADPGHGRSVFQSVRPLKENQTFLRFQNMTGTRERTLRRISGLQQKIVTDRNMLNIETIMDGMWCVNVYCVTAANNRNFRTITIIPINKILITKDTSILLLFITIEYDMSTYVYSNNIVNVVDDK